MLRAATLLFLLCLTFKSSAQPILESLAKSEMMRFDKISQADKKRSNPGKIDIRFAEIFFEPDMNNGEIKSASVKYIFKTGTDASNIEFDLRKELTVDSIVYHGSAISFLHNSDHIINITFPTLINNGSVDSLKIFYHGKTDLSTRAFSRSMTASGPNIASLSEPYGAHYWWPCRENLSDKIDSINVNLLVDTPYTAVSNGTLVETVAFGNKRLFMFRHRYPIATYLIAVSFARYNYYAHPAYLSSINQTMDIQNYVFPHTDDTGNRNKTFETVKIIRLYDSLYGTYPFYKEHYGHAQFTWGGGMEHQTMSFMINFNFDLIAHELAHQWFGDKITCGSWQNIWLNESFATYSNFICYNFLGTKQEWINQLKKNKADVMSLPAGAVFKKDTGDVDALFDYRTTYQKGAMVLHQLRWLIGDQAYFSALRNYLKDTSLAYHFAAQKDLKAYFEQSSGMDLSDYFNDWISGEGYPEYDITWQQKGMELSLNIVQTQSDPSVKNFNVPIPILVRGAFKDTLIRVNINSNFESLKMMLNFKVKELIMDPDEWVLAKFETHFPLTDAASVTVFPNPFNGFIYLSLEDLEMESWEIVDVCGQNIMSHAYEWPVAKGNIEKIDCNFLAKGVYLVKIKGSGRTVMRKIVKQ